MEIGCLFFIEVQHYRHGSWSQISRKKRGRPTGMCYDSRPGERNPARTWCTRGAVSFVLLKSCDKRVSQQERAWRACTQELIPRTTSAFTWQCHPSSRPLRPASATGPRTSDAETIRQRVRFSPRAFFLPYAKPPKTADRPPEDSTALSGVSVLPRRCTR